MGKRLTDDERLARALSERDFQRRYVEALRNLAFLVEHHYDSRFSDPGTKGAPDLKIVGHGVFFVAEMKRELGALKPEQKEYRVQYQLAGIQHFVYRPSDWEIMMTYVEQLSGRRVDPELRVFPLPYKRARKKAQTSSSPSG